MAGAAALNPLLAAFGGATIAHHEAAPSAKIARASETVAPAIADEVLFEKAQRGDRDSLGVLIARYEKPLFAVLVRMTSGDMSRADDLFQETFLHAMRSAGTFNRKMSFKPWITAIAVNLVRDDARKRKVRGEVTLDNGARNKDDTARMPEPASTGECPGQSAERRDEEQVVQRALTNLTPLEREVILLHFFNSMTLQETCETLSVPLGTVKSRLHSALNRLSTMLCRPQP